MPEQKTRIVMAEDHPIFRDGLRLLIESEPSFTLAGEAVDGAQAFDLVRELKPDILLLDLSMPKLPGIEVLQKLSRANLSTKTIILTASIEDKQIGEVFQLGGKGIVLKDTATQLLIKSIKCVVAGEYWVGRSSVQGLIQALQSANTSRRPEAERRFGLTAREMEVVAAIVEGLTNKEIAQKCSISEQTVKHHLSSVFDKVGVSNRLELALFTVNHGLLNP